MAGGGVGDDAHRAELASPDETPGAQLAVLHPVQALRPVCTPMREPNSQQSC